MWLRIFLVLYQFWRSEHKPLRLRLGLYELTYRQRNPSESLREIVQLNSENERFWRDLVPRAKLMFSASDISKTVQDLDNVANGLWRMMSLISSNQQSVDQGSSRKALRLGKGFWQIRCLAEDLHQAILKAWKPGCHHSHEAKLFLEDRVETAANIFRTARSEAGFIALNFRVMFTASSPQNRVLGYATDVKVAEELASERISGPCETSVSQRARVTLVLPQSIPKTPSMPFVDDICDLLASLKRDKKQLALVLSKHQRISTLATKEGYLNLCDSVETIPLDALLCSSETNSERLDFPWKSRMTLALGLASGFLQLARTPWLQRSWAKDNIFFLRRPNTAGHCCDFTRPFISFAFNSDDACSQQSPSINPKAAVLELGILLLEIWNTKTLEKHFDKEQTPTQYYQRLALATEWLDDMSNPLPELYDKAVSHCIRGLIGGDSRFQDWEDTKFWGAVCQDIIGPLHEICKQWRSLPQA